MSDPTHTQPPVVDSIEALLTKYFNVEFDLVGGSDPARSMMRSDLAAEIEAYCNKQVVLGRIDENEAWLKLAQTTDADAVHLKSLIKQLEDHIKVLKAAQPHKGKDK